MFSHIMGEKYNDENINYIEKSGWEYLPYIK